MPTFSHDDQKPPHELWETSTILVWEEMKTTERDAREYVEIDCLHGNREIRRAE